MPSNRKKSFTQHTKDAIPSYYSQVNTTSQTPQQQQAVVLNESIQRQSDLLFLTLSNLLGSKTTVTLKNGIQYDGIYDSVCPSTLDTQLKVAKKSGTDKIIEDLNILGKDIVHLSFKDFKPPKQTSTVGSKIGFQTDTDISHKTQSSQRILQKWSPDESSPSFTTLDDELITSGEGWDQFAINESKFGISTDFNLDNYTTILDKTGSNFKQREIQAQKLAREIEKGATGNIHLKEERGQVGQGQAEDDEEMKYSSVLRESVKSQTKNNRPVSFGGVQTKPQQNSPQQQQGQGKGSGKVNITVPKLSTEAANMIRKSSIDQLSTSRTSNRTNIITTISSSAITKTPPEIIINSPNQKPTPNTTTSTTPPIVDELNRKFKPFAKSLKIHLNTRQNEIHREGRKEIIENLKSFGEDFKVPKEFGKKSGNISANKTSPVIAPIIEKAVGIEVTKPGSGTGIGGGGKEGSVEKKKVVKESPKKGSSANANVSTSSASPAKPALSSSGDKKKSDSKSSPSGGGTGANTVGDKKKKESTKKNVGLPPSNATSSSSRPSSTSPIRGTSQTNSTDVQHDTKSVVSEADSQTTSATTKSKSSFKLSVTAAEFTPTGIVPPLVPTNVGAHSKRSKDKGGYKQYKNYNSNGSQQQIYMPFGNDAGGFYPPMGDPQFGGGQFYPPPYPANVNGQNSGFRPQMMPRGYPMPLPPPHLASAYPPQQFMHPGQYHPQMYINGPTGPQMIPPQGGPNMYVPPNGGPMMGVGAPYGMMPPHQPPPGWYEDMQLQQQQLNGGGGNSIDGRMSQQDSIDGRRSQQGSTGVGDELDGLREDDNNLPSPDDTITE